MSKKWLFFLVALSIAFPLLFSNVYLIHILVTVGINIILVLSLNLITGFAGQVSIGHAAFFGIGAYASGLLALQGVPVWIAMALGVCLSALAGLLIGYPVLRLRGHYFVIASLGFCEIIHLILNNWIEVTQGPMGLSGIPRPEPIFGFDFSEKFHYYYLLLALVSLTIYLTHSIRNSKMGRALMAIRTDEITAGAMGVNVTYYKVVAFTLSSAVAGLAGVSYTHFLLFLSPETFNVAMSVNILLMLLIGGTGSILGSVLGAMFITILSEYLREFAEYQMLIYGVLIIVIVTFSPKGLSGIVTKGITFMKRQRPESKKQAAHERRV